MHHYLSSFEIDQLLLSQSIGHLGCTDGKKPYVVPVTYLYDDGYIYGQTREGKKLDIMRGNPCVCLEVSRYTDMFNWESAIVWGTFEELEDKPATEARHALFERVFQLMTPFAVHGHEHAAIASIEDERYRPVMYRIRITEKTGRVKRTQPAS